MNIVAVLGAADPEMEAIERLLSQAGMPCVHAIKGGSRVHPGAAYRADWLSGEIPYGAEVWVIECDGPAIEVLRAQGREVVTIDHHRPGDPGYGRPPSAFMPASSIGQVISLLARRGLPPVIYWCLGQEMDPQKVGSLRLGYKIRRNPDGSRVEAQGYPVMDPVWWVRIFPDWADTGLARIASVPQELVLTAAADHCLGAAYRGECPGVDPDELMRWRAKSRAAFQARAVEAVMADVEAAQAALRDADEIELASGVVADMRRPEPIPELPEAAMRMDVGYISGPLIGQDGRHKYTCSGRPEIVSAFMQEWAPDNGLTDIYGDPARGFAGGYLD